MTNMKSLMELAIDRGGLFTYSEAIASGYKSQNISAMVKSGTFEKIAHGIYKISAIPKGKHEDFVALSLWGRGKSQTGDTSSVIISHQSALAFHELGDFMPRLPVDITIADNKFVAPIPPAKINRHEDKIGLRMLDQKNGFQVSSPLRALIETFTEGSFDQDSIYQAARDAVIGGLLTRADVTENTSFVPAKLLEKIEDYFNQRKK